LSREVALFGGFSAAAVAYAATWPLGIAGSGRLAIGASATALGIAGIFASARLYLVPARPAWNSPRTVLAFFATAVASGPVMAALALGGVQLPSAHLLVAVAAAATVVQLAMYQYVAAAVAVRKDHEWLAFGRLLFRRFRSLFAVRLACGLASVVLALSVAATPSGSGAATLLTLTLLAAAIIGEFIGRYLFYVTVVPMTADGSFFRGLR
jgi:anaerobic dimethyl sulfoxide reductase subunit C (anchor subunit)